MTGVISGGWEYVCAAYAVTAAILLGYAFSVYWRYRIETRRGTRTLAGAPLPPDRDRCCGAARAGAGSRSARSRSRRSACSRSPWAGSARTSSTTGARPSCRPPAPKAIGATIRLGGLVADGSVRRAAGVSGVEFDVVDRTGAVTHVKCSGVPPQMFREGIGVVVEGTLTRDGHFEGNRLMVSHGNEYRAPRRREGGDRPADEERSRG